MDLSVIKGIISKIIYHDGEPIVIQTDAHVYNGLSGGLLLNLRNGNLGGIVTSTIHHKISNQTFSRLNSSIPINLINPLLQLLTNNNASTTIYTEQNLERENLLNYKEINSPNDLDQDGKLFKYIKQFSPKL